MSEHQNNTPKIKGNAARGFWSTPIGYYIMSFMIAAVIWGIVILFLAINDTIAVVIALVCAIFGWMTLNRIQPAMFIWMSWFGWLLYFVIKLILSAIIGLFVAPFKIGRWIADAIQASI